jgi:S1-C subfamily serine protease
MRNGARLAAFLAVAVVAGAALSLPILRVQPPDAGMPTLAQAAPAPAPEAPPTGPLAEAPIAVPDSREAISLSFAPVVKRVAPAVVNVYATARAEAPVTVCRRPVL